MTAPRRVYRTDIGSLRPVERRPDGTIRVDAFLSKCGVFQYMQPDGTIRRELRLPEDVFDAESLRSFEGVPVTNNHPPGMLDAKNVRQYQVGSLLGAPGPDEDHMRGRMAVYDEHAIRDMESGKTQVSNGYVCDTLETPGIHPQYGVYDAIQKNIVGNHVAIVDRARAGITASARMDADRADGVMVLPGTESAKMLTPRSGACNSGAMASPATARLEVIVKHDAEPSATAKVDPDDLASRNAAGSTSAHDAGGDRARAFKPADPEMDPDESQHDEPMHDSMYDDDGNLTDGGAAKVAASSFGIPSKQRLPIHDPKACRDSMKKFGSHEFDDADEKHAAFSRIAGKAKQFGINTAGFEKAHAGKLDRADSAKKDNQMTPQEIKDLQEKADKRKEKLVAAKSRVDALETELAVAQGEIQNLTKALETAKTAPRADAADDKKFAERVDAQVSLLEQARATGAKVEAKMSARDIKVAVIKHVDGDDVPADKHEAYVDGVFEGSLKRAKKDAAETAKGANALAATRQVAAAAAHADNADDDTDEDAAKRRLRSDSVTAWSRKESK